MAGEIIRPKDLTPRPSPVASELMVVDNSVNVGAATIKAVVEAGRPAASQAEAQAGTDPSKAMTPLTTKQSIASEVGVSVASKAQGDLATTAVQPGSLAAVAFSGAYADLSGKPVLGTAAATEASAYATAAQGAKADTALQSVVAGLNVSIDNTDPRNPVVSAAGGGGLVDILTPGPGISIDSTDPTAPVVSASPSPELLNGRVGNIKQISKAIRNGAAKVVIVGDSISVGLSQTSYGDSFPGLVADHLRQSIGIAWTFENYSIDGTGVGEYVNPGYMGSYVAGPAHNPPNYELWPNGDTPTKPWRDFAKDAAPDLMIIAFGMNASSDEGASAAALNSIIDYIQTWAKVPSIVIVTPMLSSRVNGGGAPYQYVQALADAWRGVASQRNLSLSDANALYRLLLDGVDVLRTPKRRRDFSDFSGWVDITGTRPSVAGGTMTFAATGWVMRPEFEQNCEVSATFNMDGSDIADLIYRREGTNGGYILRIVHGAGGSTFNWFGPGNALIHSQGLSSAASYKVHVEAIGPRHLVWVNNQKMSLPNGGLDYSQLYPGQVGINWAQGAGTVTAFDARLGAAKVYGGPRYTEADLLGINDWASNPDSIGGNAINHPSVIASLLVYFASFKPLMDALQGAAQAQLPATARQSTSDIVTSFVAGDYIETFIGGTGPAQVSYMGGVSPNQLGVSSNVVVLSNVSSAVISGRKNGAQFITHTLTFPHVGTWLVYSTLTASTSGGGVRHALSSFGIEVQ